MKWRVSLQDVRMKIELRAGLENLRGIQIYQGVAEIAAAVFGDGKSKNPAPNPDDIPKNAQEAKDLFARLMGG